MNYYLENGFDFLYHATYFNFFASIIRDIGKNYIPLTLRDIPPFLKSPTRLNKFCPRGYELKYCYYHTVRWSENMVKKEEFLMAWFQKLEFNNVSVIDRVFPIYSPD